MIGTGKKELSINVLNSWCNDLVDDDASLEFVVSCAVGEAIKLGVNPNDIIKSLRGIIKAV